jgi:hypothetical protein
MCASVGVVVVGGYLVVSDQHYVSPVHVLILLPEQVS